MHGDQGVLYTWIFHYIPIGRNPDLELIVTPEQRLWVVDRVAELRETFPMAMVDFWNDGHQTEGCIAGGRLFAHITAAGEVEPCGFVHFSIDSINDTSLVQALNSPLFTAFAERQPFNDNLLAPCPFIDNPHALREIIGETGACGTHPGAEECLAGDTAQYLDDLSARWLRVSREKNEEMTKARKVPR